MKTKAYSYIRFSSPQQAEGHSFERQMKAIQKYVEKHNLELDTELDMTDLGVSAYKGANIAEGGALGAFIKAVENGTVAKGSYLLVENLDRLSREDVTTALQLFLNLINSGIVIVTLMDKMKFERGKVDEMQLFGSIMIMSRAHDESRTKAKRSKKNWKKRRDNIAKEKYTKWSPKWLTLSKDRTKFKIIEDRAEIVKKIFEWTAAGLGTTLIIKKLESMNVAPWDMGDKGMNKKRLAKRWYPSYIQRLLQNRAALGEFKLNNSELAEGYEIIKNYYPAIVSEELFYSAILARQSRDINKGGLGAGRKGTHFSNLFTGIAYCGYSFDSNDTVYRCGGDEEKMAFINKGGKYRYLQCTRVKDGTTGCSNCAKMWRYDAFEKSFLTFINDIDVSTISGYSDNLSLELKRLRATVTTLQGRHAELERQIARYADAMDGVEKIPQLMIEKVYGFESELNDIEKQLKFSIPELSAKEMEYENSDVNRKGIEDLVRMMKSCDGEELFDLRMQLSNVLKKFIEKILVFPSGSRKPTDEADYIKLKKILSEIYGQETGEEAEAELRKIHNEKGQNATDDPFFHVIYKSGKQTFVTPSPSDPKKFIGIITVDKNGDVDLQSPWFEAEQFNMFD